MNTCTICKKEIKKGIYRCELCDKAYQYGYDLGYHAGKVEIRQLLKKAFGD